MEARGGGASTSCPRPSQFSQRRLPSLVEWALCSQWCGEKAVPHEVVSGSMPDQTSSSQLAVRSQQGLFHQQRLTMHPASSTPRHTGPQGSNAIASSSRDTLDGRLTMSRSQPSSSNRAPQPRPASTTTSKRSAYHSTEVIDLTAISDNDEGDIILGEQTPYSSSISEQILIV